jgi:hypothetical protein
LITLKARAKARSFRLMEKPPMEWVDKLFNCMREFYGSRWTDRLGKTPEGLVKTVWQSALQGLTYDEIRGALVLLKQAAKSGTSIPPHQMEFFHIAKGRKTADIYNKPRIPETEPSNPDVARKHLAEIRNKLNPAGCST